MDTIRITRRLDAEEVCHRKAALWFRFCATAVAAAGCLEILAAPALCYTPHSHLQISFTTYIFHKSCPCAVPSSLFFICYFLVQIEGLAVRWMASGGDYVQEFLAGNMSGLIGVTLIYPLDTAKVRLQTSSKYKSSIDVIRRMVRKHGVTSVYRGIALPALGFGLTSAFSFSAYSMSCRLISDAKGNSSDSLSFCDRMVAGAAAGFIQSPLRQVMDRVKSVMQVSSSGQSAHRWSGACAADLVRREGWRRGLFRGTSSVVLRDVAQYAVCFATYERVKDFLDNNLSSKKLVQVLAGGIAGTVTWLPPFYFMDVIKSRMTTAEAGQYKGLWHCAKKLYREEGRKVYFRGLGTTLLRAFSLHGIIFLSYEYLLEMMTAPSTQQQQQQKSKGKTHRKVNGAIRSNVRLDDLI